MPLPTDRNTQKPLEQKLQEVNLAYTEKETIENAKKLGLSYVDVAKFPINVDLLYLLTEEECLAAKMIPFFRVGKKLRVALVNPELAKTQEAFQKLRDAGYALNINLTTEYSLLTALKSYHVEFFKHKKELENVYETEDLGNMMEEIQNLSSLKEQISRYSGEESANALLVGGVRAGASDIHIEPYENVTKVRFRIDGVLQDVFSVPKEQAVQMVNQMKHLAHVKLNINNRPQDGRFSFYVNHEKIDVRLSSLPVMFGETLVMRLLINKPRNLKLVDLGLTGNALKLVEAAIARPNGLILSTGPTGSGKTTTLYALLNLLNKSEAKIITLEDPVEYYVEGLVQSQINPELQYDFAAGLRSVLRQDPNVIMVGEIRDRETAEIACQASLTGHIVLSTLHTNDAVGTIPRLLNIGSPPFVLAPALDTVIAQRLVRRICNECRTAHQYTDAEMQLLDNLVNNAGSMLGLSMDRPDSFFVGAGCEKCSYTGYHGQLGIFEVFTVDKAIERMILEMKSASDLFSYLRANQKMLTLREDGALRVLQGVTTLNEILRVTSDLEE